jgi:Rod binding domain-containing protein
MTTSISNYTAAASSQLPATLPPRDFLASSATASRHAPPNVAEVRRHFTQFVGEAFFGQMIKAMRSTVGKPAYFHGGRAEDVFQGQLDQKLAEHLTEASAERLAEPMFARQFPHLAAELKQPSVINQLAQLARR